MELKAVDMEESKENEPATVIKTEAMENKQVDRAILPLEL